MRFATALAGACRLLVGLAAPALPASDSSWEGPADCGQPDLLFFAIERALGMPLERAGQLELHVRVEGSASPAIARLSVTSEGRDANAKERVLVELLDLGGLGRVDTLAIRENAVLRQVVVGALERVGDLQIVNNPRLSTAGFGQVQSFTNDLSGNLDASTP